MKGIILDKDGTLMQIAPFWVPVTQAVFRQFAAECADPAACLRELEADLAAPVGMSSLFSGTYGMLAASLSACLARYGGPAVTEADILRAFARHRGCGRVLPTVPGLPVVLSALREMGAHLFLVTTDAPQSAAYCLARLGVSHLFDAVYGDDGVHPPKPDPAVARTIASRIGARPADLLMVGDSVTDMRFAHRAGMTAVCVGGDGAAMAEGDVCLTDVSELGQYIKEKKL